VASNSDEYDMPVPVWDGDITRIKACGEAV
jgi:hypothetical protein